MPNEPRLSEEQVGAILRRAAELQESQGRPVVESGVATADILKIGAELGLDPRCLRQAIEEAAAGLEAPKKRGFWGARAKLDVERVIPGELTDDAWHSILSALRSRYNRMGAVSEVAGAHEWDGKGDGVSPIHVSLRSKDGQTRVKVLSDTSPSAVVFCAVALAPTIMATAGLSVAAVRGLGATPLGGFAAAALGLVGIGALIAKGHSLIRNRRQEAVQETLGTIAGILAAEGEATQTMGSPQTQEIIEQRLNQP